MMLRSVITALLLSSTLGLSLPAYAQVTDQTDQSEEDWRQSQKKSGTSDIYRTPNTIRTGLGLPQIDYEPPTALERLPSESRRHIMRERAKAIAESPDGDLSNVAYTPSEAAKSDEQLRRDEEAAWQEVTASPEQADGADSQDSSSTSNPSSTSSGMGTGQSPQTSPSSGQGRSASQGPRGGSTASLQEIMDAIKSGQSGSGTGASSSASQDNSSQGEGSGGSGSDGAGDASDEGQSGGQNGNGSSSASASEDQSPLELIRRSREDRPAVDRKRSASDYLGQESDQTQDD